MSSLSESSVVVSSCAAAGFILHADIAHSCSLCLLLIGPSVTQWVFWETQTSHNAPLSQQFNTNVEKKKGGGPIHRAAEPQRSRSSVSNQHFPEVQSIYIKRLHVLCTATIKKHEITESSAKRENLKKPSVQPLFKKALKKTYF